MSQKKKVHKTGGLAAWPKAMKVVYISMGPEMN
jgi:hypothetical protein